MPWSQNHRSEGLHFYVPIDGVVSESQVRGSAFFVFIPIDSMVSESQVRGSVFLFVFPLMPWSQNHRSEGVHFCLCSH